MIWAVNTSARIKGISSENVQLVGDELLRISKQYGSINPEVVIQEAENIGSPLHPVFEWDDSIAAREHRIWQARNLIKSVRVVTQRGEEQDEQRVYVNVITGTSRGYMYIPEVMSNDLLRQQVLRKAKADLLSWRERYKELNELAHIFTAIDSLEDGEVERAV